MMRPGGERRGNSYDRRARKLWLLDVWGTGRTCRCVWCGKRLTVKTLTVDRLTPGRDGGRYIRTNIVPSCFRCNNRRGAKPNRKGLRYPPVDYTTREFKAMLRCS